MRALSVVLIGLLASGCAANVKLGAPFSAAEHGSAPPDSAKIVIYQSPQLHGANYHFISVDENPPQKIARGGFATVSLLPGPHAVRAQSRWVAQSLVAPGYRAHGPEQAELNLQPGEVAYLMIQQRLESRHVECAIDGDTARICTVTNYMPQIDIQTADEALPALTELKEICDDC